MSIMSVTARQIFDSCGDPTVEVDVTTSKGVFRASVPSGSTTGSYEAIDVRDGGKDFMGLGVQTAVQNVNILIANALIQAQPDITDQQAVDNIMLDLDGTDNKGHLGANAVTGVSMAVCRAGAAEKGVPLYRHIADIAKTKELTLPCPVFSFIMGGNLTSNKLTMQEITVMPVDASSFSEAMRIGTEVYHTLKNLIKSRYGPDACSVCDSGGFAPSVQDNNEGFDLLQEAVKVAGYKDRVKLGIAAAAYDFCRKGSYVLDYKNATPDMSHKVRSKDLCDFYKKIAKRYDVVTFEDPFDVFDFSSYAKLTASASLQIVGDNLMESNYDKVRKGIENKRCNSVMIKLNQIGTVSEAIAVARMAQTAGWGVMVAHRTGETEDSFIADLTVGLGAGQIKSGAPCRTERLAKYNQLLRIEEQLGPVAKFAGGSFRKSYMKQKKNILMCFC